MLVSVQVAMNAVIFIVLLTASESLQEQKPKAKDNNVRTHYPRFSENLPEEESDAFYDFTKFTFTNDSKSTKPVMFDTGMITAIVCVFLLVVITTLLMLLRWNFFNRKENSEQNGNALKNTEANQQDSPYKEIQPQKEDLSTVHSVYCTINLPMGPQPYANLKFLNDEATVPDENGSCTSDSSPSATGPPAETTV